MLTRTRRMVAEPFVHFLLLGALIFGAHALFNPGNGAASHDIVVSAADMDRLRALAAKQFGNEPDAARLRELVRAFVREEVLYREALAQGLDGDDVVVRRRLVQKWEFLSQSNVQTPSEAEARAYHAAHAPNYTLPARHSFEHIVFSRDRHAGKADSLAAEALQALRGGKAVAGDASMLPRTLAQLTQAEVARDFGAEFAAALAAIPADGWHGPYPSPLGVHLVRISARHPAELESYDISKDRVVADLANARLQQARDSAYEQARQRYRISLPPEARQ